MNLPNKLTMLRIIMIPLFIVCFFLPDAWIFGTVQGNPIHIKYCIAGIIFLLAYITDTLDGIIARKRNMVTDFGKLMDPTADKLLTGAAMVMLCKYEVMSFGNFLMPVFTFIVLGRELFVSGMRQLAAAQGKVVAAKKIGKAKTTVQFIALLIVLLFGEIFAAIKVPVDFVLVCIAVALTIWSGIDYAISGKYLFQQR